MGFTPQFCVGICICLAFAFVSNTEPFYIEPALPLDFPPTWRWSLGTHTLRGVVVRILQSYTAPGPYLSLHAETKPLLRFNLTKQSGALLQIFFLPFMTLLSLLMLWKCKTKSLFSSSLWTTLLRTLLKLQNSHYHELQSCTKRNTANERFILWSSVEEERKFFYRVRIKCRRQRR